MVLLYIYMISAWLGTLELVNESMYRTLVRCPRQS